MNILLIRIILTRSDDAVAKRWLLLLDGDWEAAEQSMAAAVDAYLKWSVGRKVLLWAVVGALVGLAVGWTGAWVMRRVALPASGLYPIAAMTLTVLAYSSSAAVHASGFAAVYVAALVLGNSELPHRSATRSFAEGMAWLAQIGLFVMLGLLASPGRIELSHVVYAVLAGLVLTLVARPLSASAP